MSSFSIRFDTDALTRELTDTARRQIPFATAKALNATANDMQAGIRNQVTGRGFVIRSDNSARWLKQQIRRNPGEDFATKRQQVARVRIQDQGRASLLSLIDQGGQRTSRFAVSGAGTQVAVPVRRTPAQRIPRTQFPAALQLKATPKGQIKGARGAFVVKTKAGDTLVLQRTGKRKVQLRFVLERAVGVRPRQFFAPIAEKVALGRFNQNLDYALREALRTAR